MRAPDASEPLIVVAQIVRPHGVRGEVKALVLTRDGAQLGNLTECYLMDPRREIRRRCRIERCRLQGQAVILALQGCQSMDDAEALAHWLVAVPEEALAPLPPGTFYAAKLEGARVVTEEGVEIGEFVGLEEAPGHDLWVIRAGGREHLIPAVAEIVRQVDLRARRITIRLPEGLLELSNR